MVSSTVAQALWTASEIELGQLAAEHTGEVQRLYDCCEAALRAAEASAAERERSPSDGCGVQHNPLFDHVDGCGSEAGSQSDAGLSSSDGDGAKELGAAGDDKAATVEAALRHAAELASVRAACQARLDAAQEEIEIKSARLAALEVVKRLTIHDAAKELGRSPTARALGDVDSSAACHNACSSRADVLPAGNIASKMLCLPCRSEPMTAPCCRRKLTDCGARRLRRPRRPQIAKRCCRSCRSLPHISRRRLSS